MKKRNIIIFFFLLFVLMFSMRTGFAYEWQLWSERFHFSCYETTEDQMIGCIKKYYHEQTLQHGAMSAMDDVRKGYDRYPNMRNYCHQITHTIGRATAEGGSPLGQLFAEGDPFCWSGYYHGAVEGKLRGVETTQITPEFVNNFCTDIPKTEGNYFHYFNCVHGAGHAFMYITDNDLPDALNRCKTFRDNDDRQNCAAGTFMENIVASQDDHNTEYIRPSEPYFPCTMEGIDSFYEICYTTQATLIWQNAREPAAAFRECVNIPDITSRNACTEGLGREIAGGSLNTVEKTIANCSSAGTEEALGLCIVGAMKNFIAYYHDDVLARELCTASGVARTCDEARKEYIKLFASTTSAT